MVGVAAGVGAVGSIAGGLIGGAGAKSAASQQAAAAEQAAQLEQQRYLQTRSDLQPYNQAGQANLPALQNQYQQTQAGLQSAWNTAQAAVPGQMTQSQLLQTPGYQFNLDQGLKAVQNQQTGRGLGISGNAGKAAASYATGLANSTYKDQFNIQNAIYADQAQQFQNANTGYNTVFNQLYNPASLGENAAAQTGSVGANLGIAQGGQVAAAGQALAAGTGAAAGAYGNALNGVGNAASTYALLNSNALNQTPTATGAGTGIYPGSSDTATWADG